MGLLWLVKVKLHFRCLPSQQANGLDGNRERERERECANIGEDPDRSKLMEDSGREIKFRN